MTRRSLLGWLVGLVAVGRTPLAWAAPGPYLRHLRVGNGGTPFQGDHALLATVSPGRRAGRAVVRFGLDEPTTVKLEIVRTGLRLNRTIWVRTRHLQPGEHALCGAPRRERPPEPTCFGSRRGPGSGSRSTARAGARAGSSAARSSACSASRRPGCAGATSPARRLGCGSRPTRSNSRSSSSATARSRTRRTGPTSSPACRWAKRVSITGRPRSRRRRAVLVGVGDWRSGLYYARITAGDGRVGYAPFVLRPRRLGEHRVAVVLPTNTWQAYNFRDADGDGWGDTWYAGGSPPVVLDRPFLANGVPPRFKKHDRAFVRWLHWTRREVDYLCDEDLERVPTGDRLRQLYDLVVFPGHSEYVTEHAYDVVERHRDLGGNLLFLSANNFFWKVERRGRRIRRVGLWRDLGRPESRLIGVQYVANDDGSIQRPFAVRNAVALPWLWEGTGLADGQTFGEFVGGFGTEIDAVTRHSPRGTTVAAEIVDLFGPGQTAQMTYYETAAGARVFAAGVLDFGGAVTFWPMRRMLENIWKRLTA